MNEIKLGDVVRSTVSGFTGTVTGLVEYLHGVPTALVTAPKLTDGEIKSEWLALSELEIVPGW